MEGVGDFWAVRQRAEILKRGKFRLVLGTFEETKGLVENGRN